MLNHEKYEADRTNLPQDTTETIFDGGCHAGFGSYGAQKGDGTPTISAEEQQQQTADALAAWMNLQQKAKYPDYFPANHRRMAGTFFRIP